MVTPELINYLKTQLLAGQTVDNLRSAVANQGWQMADVEEALRVIAGEPAVTPSSAPQLDEPSIPQDSAPSKSNVVLILVIIAALICLIGGGVYAYTKFGPSIGKQPAPSAAETQQAIPTPFPVEPSTAATTDMAASSSAVASSSATSSKTVECSDFPAKLKTCTAYKCTFTHPLTGDKLTRQIKGMVNGKCSYEEGMPNNGKMTCNYTAATQKAAALYYASLATAASTESNVTVQLSPDGAQATSSTEINGQTVENPLQSALTSGECKVIGY